jgi:hypothetical protein
MSFEFKPTVTPRPGSLRPADLPPRWYRPGVLGDVVERDGVAWFIPLAKHPAVRDFGPRLLGAADNSDSAMMAEAEKVYKEALAVKKAWKAARKSDRAVRAAQRSDKKAA